MPRLKKNLRRAVALLLLIGLLPGVAGCQALDVFSVDSLLRAPKLTGENARIQQSFENIVGTDVQLIVPLTGAFRSAFVFYDYDADGVNETLVFYSRNESPSEIHIHFMDYSDGEWLSVGDVTGNGSEVYSVDFTNVDPDDFREILVSWTVSDSKRNKTLSIYKYDPTLPDIRQQTAPSTEGVRGQFKLLSAVQIYEYLALDFDFDGVQEILYLSSDTSAQSPVIKASVIKLNASTGVVEPLSEVELSKSVEIPLATLFDVRGGHRRVYFDCINFDDTYITEILEFDDAKNALIRPQNEEGEALASLTHRSEEIYSVKGEEQLVSVPIRYVYDGSYVLENGKEDAGKTPLFVTEFVRLNNGSFESASSKYYYDFADHCRVNLDDVFDQFVMEYDVSLHEIRFFDEEAPGHVMFSVRFAHSDDAQKEAAPAEEAEIPNYDIYISNPAKARRITEATIREMLEVIA